MGVHATVKEDENIQLLPDDVMTFMILDVNYKANDNSRQN